MNFDPASDLYTLLSSVRRETLKKWQHEGQDDTIGFVHDTELGEDVLHLTGKYGYNDVLVFPNRQRHFKDSLREMTLPNIHFFYKMEENPFGMDIVVEATSLKQYVLRFGTNYLSIFFRSDMCWLPLTPAKQWTQCSIDLGQLVEAAFQAKFARIVLIRIKTTIKLRKIFLTRLADVLVENVYSQIPKKDRSQTRARQQTDVLTSNSKYRENRAAKFRYEMHAPKHDKARSMKSNKSKVGIKNVDEYSIKHLREGRRSKSAASQHAVYNKPDSQKINGKSLSKLKKEKKLVEQTRRDRTLNVKETEIRSVDLSAKLKEDKSEIISDERKNVSPTCNELLIQEKRHQTSESSREVEENKGNLDMIVHRNKAITVRSKSDVPRKNPKTTGNVTEILLERKEEAVKHSERITKNSRVTTSRKVVDKTPPVERTLSESKTSYDAFDRKLEITKITGKDTKQMGKKTSLRKQVKKSALQNLKKNLCNTKANGFQRAIPNRVHITDRKTSGSYDTDRKPSAVSTPNPAHFKTEPGIIKNIRNIEMKSPESKMGPASKTKAKISKTQEILGRERESFSPTSKTKTNKGPRRIDSKSLAKFDYM